MVVIEGKIWSDGFREGYLVIEGGILKEVGEGKPPEEPSHRGTVFPGMIDCHTHLGDAGLKLDRKYTLRELVEPPNGLKHRYLASTDGNVIKRNMTEYWKTLKHYGASNIVDFREGGVKGCEMLREVCPDAVILGRPVSPEFDSNEIDEILSIADGIGLPSISDMDHGYIDKIADVVHRKKGILALHVSEREREDFEYVLTLQPDFVVHMCDATDADLRTCADYDIPVVVCPRSNMYFGFRTPLDRMIAAGVSVSIGTDNAMLATPFVFAEIEAARKILRNQGFDEDYAYVMGFSDNSKILNDGRQIHNRVGKRADLTLVSDDSMVIRFYRTIELRRRCRICAK